MARVETVKCDQCGAIKGEGNHWLVYDVPLDRSCPQEPIRIPIVDGLPLDPNNYERRDICGQECFHKNLDTLLFTKPKNQADPHGLAVKYQGLPALQIDDDANLS